MALLDRAALRLLEQLRIRVRPNVSSSDQGGQRSDRHASGLEFATHREYVPGDDSRLIDWKAFARNRSLTIRTFEAERDAHVYILVDVSASMTRGTPPKLDVGRRLAASFGYVGIKHNERVCVIPFRNTLEHATPVMRRGDEYPALERFLTGLEARGPTTFAAATRSFLEKCPGRGFVVVVSDLMEATDWSDSLRALGRRGHQLCVVRVRCDEDRAPTFRGEIELIDAETGAAIHLTATRALLDAYRSEVEAHVSRTRDACRRVGGRFVDAAVEVPVERLLRQVLAPALELT